MSRKRAGYKTELYCITVHVLRSVELSMQIAADQRSARFLPAIFVHHSNERI